MKQIVPLVFLFGLTACVGMRTVSPKEVEAMGTRTFKGTSSAAVLDATSVAVKTLGYQLTLVDRKGGRLKTAPKVVVVTAVGNGYSAVASETAVAWNIRVTSTGNKTVVTAHPRAFSGGQELVKQRWDKKYVKTMFRQLFKEVESNLGRKAEPLPKPERSKKKTVAAQRAR
jgi:hypothetical protein